jgi:hypothetical protein
MSTARIATAWQKDWKMSTAQIIKNWKSGTCKAVWLKNRVGKVRFLSFLYEKIKHLYLTVAKILSTAWNFEQLHFLINSWKIKCGTCTAYFCLSSRWHFQKSVEQSRFESMNFNQLTLTQKKIDMQLFWYYHGNIQILLLNLSKNLPSI